MIPCLTLSLALHLGGNKFVRSIPVNDAVVMMQKWCLELKLQNDEVTSMDGDIDIRMTDDSLSGPFKLVREPEDNSDIANIRDIMTWVQHQAFRSKKGVFVAIINGDPQMLSFVQVFKNKIHVHGFLSCPSTDPYTHNEARSMLVLELLDMASNSETNILFLFE